MIDNYIIILAAHLTGIVVGFFLRGFAEKKSFSMSEQASKNFLLLVVALIWAFAMVIDISDPSYDVPVAVHGIMGAIVGFFFWRPGQGGGK